MSRTRLLAVSLLLFATGATQRLYGQATRAPYTEGSVWVLSLLQVKPGRQDDYLNIQRATTKRLLDEEKRQGLVLSYHFPDPRWTSGGGSSGCWRSRAAAGRFPQATL